MIALFTALIAPFFIDWTKYKQDFEREASRIIGQPVQVAGTASVRVLPFPTVTFSDLSVGQYGDGTAMMTLESFSMDAELMPFLRGQVRIVDMRLNSPRLVVRVNENGTIDWTDRKELLVDPDKVQLSRVRVEDATVRLEGIAGGRVLEASKVDAELSARSLLGPWRIEAAGEVEGRQSRFDITTGRVQESGSVRLRINAEREGEPYDLALDGPVALSEGVLGWSGTFRLSPQTDSGDTGEALPVVASGDYAATPNRVDINEYRLEIGDREDPYTLTGSAWANIREEIFFNATADGRQIDLDRLNDDASTSAAGTDLATRIAVVREILDKVPVPAISGRLDFSLPAIVAGDTVIRELRAIVQPDNGGWNVASLKTIFPGNTIIEAKGRLGVGRDFGFAGDLLVASRQPTGFANWLSGKSNASLRRLSSAGLSAQAAITGSQFTLENLEMVLDGVRLTGRLQRISNGDERPAIIAELTGERINIDQLQALYSLMESGEGANITSHDLDIKLAASTLEGQGMSARDVEGRVRVEAGSISIDSLNAGDFYGAAFRSSGKMDDLMGKPSGNLTLAVRAGDLSRLARLAANKLGENPFFSAFGSDPSLSTDTQLDLSIEARPVGSGSKGTLAITGTVGGTQIEVSDRLQGEPGKWRKLAHELSVKLNQSESLLLAQQFALPVLPMDGPGPVSLSADFSGVIDDGMTVSLAVTAPHSDFSVNGRMEPDGTDGYGKPELDLSFTLASGDAEPWLQMAGYPMPGSGLGTPVTVSGDLFASEGRYQAENLSGQYAGSGFSGAFEIDGGRKPRPHLGGSMEMENLSLPLFAELLLGNGTVAGDPLISDGEVRDADFGKSMLDGLDGTISLFAEEASLGENQKLSQFTGQFTLLDGALTVERIGAQWLGGELGGNFTLKNTGQGALANAQLQLSAIDLARASGLAGFAGLFSGTGDANATLEANGRSFRALLAGISGSGVMQLGELGIAGLRTAGLTEVLEIADEEEFEINTANVKPLAEAFFLTGTFDTKDVTVPFAVTKGRVSVRSISVSDGNGAIRAEGDYRPVSGVANASITIEPDPGKQALAGAEPAMSFDWSREGSETSRETGTAALEGYLSLRAFEREQRRVEILQASVLEKQRLRREVIVTNARIALREEREREELRKLEELQQKLLEEKRQRDEAEQARLEAEEEARREAEAEAERQAAEEKLRLEAEEAARQQQEELERQAAEQARSETQVPQVLEPQPLLRPQRAPRPQRRQPANNPRKTFGFGSNQ